MKPYITVVIPVRNEERFIADTLGQLLAQDYPADRYEIIVADGMSDDGTREIVSEIIMQHPQVRLLDNPNRLSSAGRNVGFRNGKGDLFLVVDGHCFIPDHKLLLNVADCFEQSGADCLGRPQPLDPPHLSTFQRSVAIARESKLGHGGDSLIYGQYEGYASPVSNGAAYRRDVFEKIGYVDESFDACEDVEFNFRVEKAGMKAYTSPRLTIRYYPRGSYKELFRQMIRYGRGRFRLIRKNPDALTGNQLVPTGFVLGIVALFISAVAGFHVVSAPLGVGYGIYFVLICLESVRLAAVYGWRRIMHFPFIFFTIHFALGAGFLREMVAQSFLVFLSDSRHRGSFSNNG